ncbi:DNA replication protein psf1 [Malassezia caprae]|uniref:DNA replication complex GINS protein PSF1 n=1 Tax=Malassezia caprae TaxID=1381934 RepID=A0AAF0IXB1_9BASI|nr:DNA replication protein psf1 [Malassezia caprae]
MPNEHALQLVHEAKLSASTGALRAYSTELVRLALLETRQLHAELAPLAAAARSRAAEGERADAATTARLVTQHLQAYRNKRCLLAYHRHRLDWLRSRVWDKAGAVSLVLDEDSPQDARSIRPLLEPAELEWLRSYAALVGLYKDAYLDVLDVTLPLATGAAAAAPARARAALGGHFDVRSTAAYTAPTPPNAVRPPDDVMISVVVTRDARSVETERGTLHLRAGERLYVRRDEVEALLLRGWLRETDT